MKKKKFVEIHQYKVIAEYEEIYPETLQKLIRPQVSIKKAVGKVILALLVSAVMGLGLAWFIVELTKNTRFPLNFGGVFAIAFVLLLGACMAIFLKKIIIFFIRLYQRYGPYDIRSRCLFTPNCSEYMVLAIQKYGAIKGVKKGIERFKRCQAPNGGIDYP